MSDVLTPQQRSYCMSRNRGRDTAPELAVRRELRQLGVYYRIKSRLVGKPDIVFHGRKVCVFIDGCFWHKCPDHYNQPKQNAEKWIAKIERNVERDRYVSTELHNQGWTVLRFWEHEVKTSASDVARRIVNNFEDESLSQDQQSNVSGA